MNALEFITGHVIYNLAYTYKFQLKTTLNSYPVGELCSWNFKFDFSTEM